MSEDDGARNRFTYFRSQVPADWDRESEGRQSLPQLNFEKLTDPRGYIADEGLVSAVNVALALNQPLLLTGAPGTGKTELAKSVAYQLSLEPLLRFTVKSDTSSSDLFYDFDTVARFREAQSGSGDLDPKRFLTFAALGQAILKAMPAEQIKSIFGPKFDLGRDGTEAKRSVVLIDEIDKAPRDVPNDLLAEIDTLSFTVPEFERTEFIADPAYRPIVVITSNSEKALPDAFLRRCVYYNIPFPEDPQLRDIISSRIGLRVEGTSTLLNEALIIFRKICKQRLRKTPGTAELIDWITLLVGFGLKEESSIRECSEWAAFARSTLFKTKEDLKIGLQLDETWLTDNADP